MTNRTTLMTAFLDEFFTDDYTVVSLAGDASFRRYHRIFKGDDTYLLMDAPPEKESVVEFVAVAEIMGKAVNTPDILKKDMDNGFLLLQDFGEVEFAHLIKANDDNNELYQKALLALKDIQSIDINSANIPPYSDEKYETEMNLFTEWFLPYIGQTIDDTLWTSLKQAVINNVQTQPKVVVHRDYHSRNLMADKNSDRLGVIDFQDALIGAYSYDLVSLVRDAYIDVDETWVNQQIKAFYEILNPNLNPNSDLTTFTKEVNIMGVQRHLKVLGIFIRLYQRDGKEKYLGNIPKVMNDLIIELQWLKEHNANAIYGEFLAFIKNILPSYQEKFAKS